MAKEPNQDDERNGDAQEQKQNGTHRLSPSVNQTDHITGTRSRSLPPIVAARLAQNAPINRARNVQYMECATALRAASAACRPRVYASSTRFSASDWLTPVLAATTWARYSLSADGILPSRRLFAKMSPNSPRADALSLSAPGALGRSSVSTRYPFAPTPSRD